MKTYGQLNEAKKKTVKIKKGQEVCGNCHYYEDGYCVWHESEGWSLDDYCDEFSKAKGK